MHIHMMTLPLQAAQANLTITPAVQPVLPQQRRLQHQPRQPRRPRRPQRQLKQKPSNHQLRFQQDLKQFLQLYLQQHPQQNF